MTGTFGKIVWLDGSGNPDPNEELWLEVVPYPNVDKFIGADPYPRVERSMLVCLGASKLLPFLSIMILDAGLFVYTLGISVISLLPDWGNTFTLEELYVEALYEVDSTTWEVVLA